MLIKEIRQRRQYKSQIDGGDDEEEDEEEDEELD
jgi:hypothetical protein